MILRILLLKMKTDTKMNASQEWSVTRSIKIWKI